MVMAMTASAQRYQSMAYSVEPPTGWTTTGQEMIKGNVAFLGPHEKDFTVNINILSEPAPREALTQYVQAIHRQVAAGKEMTILKESSTKLSGTPAHSMMTELRLKKRTDVPLLRVHQVYAMHKDRAYIVTLTYPKSVPTPASNKLIAAFNKLVASFRWEQEARIKP